MRENSVKVGMGDYQIGKENQTLITYGLGSCVGIAIYDKEKHIGGLAHIMLPSAKLAKSSVPLNTAKYADTAIREMIAKLIGEGGDIVNFESKIFGGAKMFSFVSDKPGSDIGSRNVEAVKGELKKQRIPIMVEIVGADFGRTIEFNLIDGSVKVISVNKPVKIV
ncbi:chemotaxis protein CheD [bacterium]|nr:chemotaxis protein CheD [bacterium]